MRLNSRPSTRHVPKTDLDKFVREILSRGPDAALPQNLPNRWLRALARDIAVSRKAKEQGKDDSDIDISAPLLVVIALLNGADPFAGLRSEISDKDLMEGLESFEQALYDEIVGRETGVFLREYNIGNIVHFIPPGSPLSSNT
jgi:hypothetical protein